MYMQGKHLGKIIGLLALMFASTFGQTVDMLMKQGASYDTGMGYGLLLSLANLALVSVIMMAAPLICRLIRKEKLEFKTGKKLCLWNSIILFVLSSVLLIITETNFIGGVGAIIYYFINRWTFVKENEHSLAPKSTSQENARMSLTPDNDVPPTSNGSNTFGADIALEPCNTPPHTNTTKRSTTEETHTPAKQAVKYCSRCGKPIDPISKKCTGCGKQYFKGISAKVFFIGTLILCLILSLVLNIVLIVKLQEKSTYPTQDNKESFSSWLDKQGYGNPSNYDSYNVEIRTITIDNKFMAEYIYEQWKNGEATEASMVAIMNKYGADQGGGQLHLIKPGDLVEEVDSWCFDRTRKIGDVAIIENAYGYTICYFASAVEQ